MTGTRLCINAHGDRLHKTAIAIATLLCCDKGYVVLDGAFFRDKYHYPGEPDVYIKVPATGTTSRGRRYDLAKRYVIEIETHATRSSIEKKTRQFQSSVTDHELIVVRLNDIDEHVSVGELWQIIERRLP